MTISANDAALHLATVYHDEYGRWPSRDLPGVWTWVEEVAEYAYPGMRESNPDAFDAAFFDHAGGELLIASAPA